MNGTQTIPADTQGAQANPPVENTVELSPAAKLKAENDNLESELIRAQKIRNDSLLAGTAGGQVKPEPVPELTDIEYADKFMRGEADPLGEDGISIN